MQNKKRYILIGLGLVVLAAAAFLGGQLLNGQAGSLGFLPFGGGMSSSFSLNITPAPEVPTTDPIASGNFAERKDNTIYLSSEGFVTISGSGNSQTVISVASGGSNEGAESGKKTEVVVTSDTKVFKDTTDFSDLMGGGDGEKVKQQTVEEGSLDELTTSSMVSVWGRKNGDRIIADTIVYMNPVIIQK